MTTLPEILCMLMPIYTQVPNPSYVKAKQTNLDLGNLKIWDSKKNVI